MTPPSWWIRDPPRLHLERGAIAQLAENETWLSDVHWCLRDNLLNCEAIIRAHGHAYAVRLIYPAFYPALCPAVVPLDDKRRWSGHQYGPGGTLCLELRPDTWHPQYTGADMLRSAQALLTIENPLGAENIDREIAPSAHQESFGALARASKTQFFMSVGMIARMKALPTGSIVPVLGIKVDGSGLLLVNQELASTGRELWNDLSVPGQAAGRRTASGFVMKTADVDKHLSQRLTFEVLRDGLAAAGLTHWPHEPSTPLTDIRTDGLAIIVDDNEQLQAYFLDGTGDAPHIEPLFVIPDDRATKRQNGSVGLSTAKVAVIGVGSLGSKVALSLARAGIPGMMLMDSDVLLPGNLVRNGLDWRSVGAPKIQGVEEAVKLINPQAIVVGINVQVGGQESAVFHARVLEFLNTSDIIINATADPQTFNLLSDLAVQAKKPMLWGTVYGGGLGGFIARSRPGIDPTPAQMRGVYGDFTVANPSDEVVSEAYTYGTDAGNGETLIASDADVSVIAAHLTGMALDLVNSPGESKYPQSMYLVGLRKGWIFEQPLQVIPLAMRDPSEWPVPAPFSGLTQAETDAHFAFCDILIEELKA